MYNLYMRWVIIIRVHKNWQCLILQTLFIISLHNILYTRSHTSFNCTHHSHTLSTHMVSTTIWKIKFTSAKSYIMTGDPLSKNLTSRLCNWGLPILRIPIDFTFSHTKSAKKLAWRHYCSITRIFVYKHSSLHTIITFMYLLLSTLLSLNSNVLHFRVIDVGETGTSTCTCPGWRSRNDHFHHFSRARHITYISIIYRSIISQYIFWTVFHGKRIKYNFLRLFIFAFFASFSLIITLSLFYILP